MLNDQVHSSRRSDFKNNAENVQILRTHFFLSFHNKKALKISHHLNWCFKITMGFSYKVAIIKNKICRILFKIGPS